jgi:hypothetical protein
MARERPEMTQDSFLRLRGSSGSLPTAITWQKRSLRQARHLFELQRGFCICYSPLIALSDNAFLERVAFMLRAAGLAPAPKFGRWNGILVYRRGRLFYACYQAACYSRWGDLFA